MDDRLIAIDRWTSESQAYFLTHLHADHTRGLSPGWRRGPIFCSRVSATLFPSKFPGFDLSLIKALEIGRTYSFTLKSLSSDQSVQYRVTPIDACHCPGAVMFLFNGDFGKVLYTGDFRWETKGNRAQMAKYMLLRTLGKDKVDFLHVDNTFCHPSFSFPPREVAAQQVVDIISSYPKHDILIGIDTLGKEDLLVHISHALNTKIGSVSRCRDSKMGRNKKRALRNYCSGVRRSRVSLVRRERRGVKIIEDGFCASDLNTGIT